jgi:hypothetical protein
VVVCSRERLAVQSAVNDNGGNDEQKKKKKKNTPLPQRTEYQCARDEKRLDGEPTVCMEATIPLPVREDLAR